MLTVIAPMTTSNRVVDAILPEPVVFHLVLLPLDDLFHRQTIASRCRDHDHASSMLRGEDTIATNTFFFNLMSSRGHVSVNIGPRIPHRSFHVFP